MRHLIDPTDLSMQELDEVISLALDIIDNREKYAEVCTGIKKLKVLNKLIHHLKGFMMLFEKLGQILSLGSVC